MRYSLAGGYQANAENGSGLDYCITEADSYAEIGSVEQEIREAMAGWMESPGHRSTILDPWHRAVNVGLAWDRFNFVAIQHFEGGYVEYRQLPEIREGHLVLEGAVTNGAGFGGRDGLGIQVYYDPPPGPLTPGQLARTYCYGSGLPVAALRPPPGLLRYYDEDEFTAAYRPCPDPYNAPAGARAPRSPDEAHVYWQAAYEASQAAQEYAVTAPWVTARRTSSTTDHGPHADHGATGTWRRTTVARESVDRWSCFASRRRRVTSISRAVMDAEVTEQVGAGYGERSEARLTRRNGYRARRWDTRAGSIDLQIPKLRQGSYFPALLEPRRRAERALLSVVQQAYVEGVCRVDDLGHRARSPASAPSSMRSSPASWAGPSTQAPTATSARSPRRCARAAASCR